MNQGDASLNHRGTEATENTEKTGQPGFFFCRDVLAFLGVLRDLCASVVKRSVAFAGNHP